MSFKNTINQSNGYFGEFGGKYIPEVLRPNIEEVEKAFNECKDDTDFQQELKLAFKEISGRPTAFTPLRNLSKHLGGAQIAIKNEGLNHTGAHKINHCIGQILLAKKMGKKRIIAETGAGQHGYATASVCARYELPCTIYMGRVDYERQRPNVYWMELLGAEVIPVDEGKKTLNDAVIAAFKDLVQNPEDSFYLLGSAVGPHPYPAMNTYFQKIVSEEMKQQSNEFYGKNPDYVLACVGGGSNAMGAFYDFLDDENIKLIGVEAGGISSKDKEHASKVSFGKLGIFEGYKSFFLQDNDGNILPTHSISAGLDYCGVSPILAYLHQQGRVDFSFATDDETLKGLQLCAQKEGFILALESAHALAHAIKIAPDLPKDKLIIVNASGRGDKDLFITMKEFQKEQMIEYMKKTIKENE
ncbi:MAG: tryptophan synthase subunit beta [Flavobacteriales bacterium]|nr:tryptophan synthase subunit beta [Flavobacteriales bacterium]